MLCENGSETDVEVKEELINKVDGKTLIMYTDWVHPEDMMWENAEELLQPFFEAYPFIANHNGYSMECTEVYAIPRDRLCDNTPLTFAEQVKYRMDCRIYKFD